MESDRRIFAPTNGTRLPFDRIFISGELEVAHHQMGSTERFEAKLPPNVGAAKAASARYHAKWKLCAVNDDVATPVNVTVSPA